jgi:hypothetical protein
MVFLAGLFLSIGMALAQTQVTGTAYPQPIDQNGNLVAENHKEMLRQHPSKR